MTEPVTAMQDFTQDQVGRALANLGRYRVVRVQTVANQGAPDGISGSLPLALGLRENRLLNEEGGVKWDGTKWVKQDDPMRMDVGVFQINRTYHFPDLKLMPGVRSGTWGPVVEGKTAADAGYVMRFEDSLRWVIPNFHENMAYAESKGVVGGPGVSDAAAVVRFAIAAHNRGAGGAWRGYQEGDVDKYTAQGDYSAWVLRHRTKVNRWLGSHPNWTP